MSFICPQVGNLANDGVKLATGRGKCSAEPSDGLEKEATGGTLRWVVFYNYIFIHTFTFPVRIITILN